MNEQLRSKINFHFVNTTMATDTSKLSSQRENNNPLSISSACLGGSKIILNRPQTNSSKHRMSILAVQAGGVQKKVPDS